MSRAVHLAIAAAVLLDCGAPTRAAAQSPDAAMRAPANAAADAASLAERIRRVGSGTAVLRYAVRPGVCGDGADRISLHDESSGTGGSRWTSYGGDPAICEPGPARLTISVANGAVHTLYVAVGGPGRNAAGGTDLGTITGPVAAAYLLDVAAHAEGATADHALLAAAIAADAVIWPELLQLARAGASSSATRQGATFWAGRSACDAVRARGPHARGADTADRDVRREVVFALSQRPAGERTTALTRVARADRDPEVRCAALFWLGQGERRSGNDPAVLDLYEEVLRAR